MRLEYMEDMEAIYTEIAEYLNNHPDAADTLEGIAVWWLSGAHRKPSLETIKQILEGLVKHGRLAVNTLPDGQVLYRLAKRSK